MADEKNTATTGRDAPIDDPGREVKVSKEDRAQGVVSQRETSILGNAGVAEEAGLAGTGAGRSRLEGAQGSGSSTTATPGTPGPENNEGTVSGTTGLGVGGTTPGTSPEVAAGAGGAGARPDADDEVER